MQQTKAFTISQILSCVLGLHLIPQVVIGLHSQTATKFVTSALNKQIEVPDVHFRLVHAHDVEHGNNVIQLGILLFFVFSMFSMYLALQSVAEHSTIAVFVFRGMVGVVGSVLPCYVIAVLYGAPMTTLIPQTLSWGVIQSIFVVLPLAAARNAEVSLWRRVYALNDARTAFELCASWAGIGSVVGAWFGACLIPLDWDEPWQKWPITLIHGASLGFIVGHVVAYFRVKAQLQSDPNGSFTFLVAKSKLMKD